MIPSLHAEICPALKSRDYKGPSSDGDSDGAILVPMVSHSLRAEGFDASEDRTGRGTPIVPFVIQERAVSENPENGPQGKGWQEGVAFTLEARNKVQAVSFAQNQRGELRERDIRPQLTCGGGKPGEGFPATRIGMAVRRLTPRECERLQGFPDDWTLIPYRGKPASDGPRYRAIGNSMAVPVLLWIGKRIEAVEALSEGGAA